MNYTLSYYTRQRGGRRGAVSLLGAAQLDGWCGLRRRPASTIQRDRPRLEARVGHWARPCLHSERPSTCVEVIAVIRHHPQSLRARGKHPSVHAALVVAAIASGVVEVAFDRDSTARILVRQRYWC